MLMPMTTPDAPVLIDRDGSVAVLTLNRPAAFNSFDHVLKAALLAALGELAAAAERGEVRALVITGAGRAFCAGQDLKEHLALLSSDDPADAERAAATVVDFYNPMIKRLNNFPAPVIAALNGVAAGAGAGLAFACDLRVATTTASIRTAFAQVALSADSGLSYTLPRLVGAGRARRMTLLDEPVDAATAEQWGAVDRVVDGDVLPAALELAHRLAAGPTGAYRWIRHSLQVGAQASLEQALEVEARAQAACFASADHREALNAFQDKRKAVFDGVGAAPQAEPAEVTGPAG